jgi:hypothetical protein
MTVRQQQQDDRLEKYMNVHVACMGETRNLNTISLGKPERKRKMLTAWEKKIKIILSLNFEKYNGNVEVDFPQFYAGQRPVAISSESGKDTVLH